MLEIEGFSVCEGGEGVWVGYYLQMRTHTRMTNMNTPANVDVHALQFYPVNDNEIFKKGSQKVDGSPHS